MRPCSCAQTRWRPSGGSSSPCWTRTAPSLLTPRARRVPSRRPTCWRVRAGRGSNPAMTEHPAAAVGILGVPMDLGAGRRGTDMGPSALRLARLGETLRRLGTRVNDHGNVEVSVAEFGTPEDVGDENARYARRIVAACRLALGQLRERPLGELPLTLGGDHSISMASVAGAFQGPAACSAVIWVDAHADLNTPSTSPSGNIHGMPLAHLLGLGEGRIRDIWGGGAVLEPTALVYIGLRSVDPAE